MPYSSSVCARLLATSAITLSLIAQVMASTPTRKTAPSTAEAQQKLAINQSQAFIENKGQWDSRAKFLAQSPGIDSWVTEDGVVYDFHRFVPDSKQAMQPRGKFQKPPSGTRYGHVVKMSFEGAQPAQLTASKELKGKLNYFLGNDHTKWANKVRRFGEAHAEQIYYGISARYYFDNGAPRYDLVVAPGADPSKIQMKFEGADSLDISPNGALRIGTHLGTVEQRGLALYQGEGANKTQVNAQMVTDGTSVRFQIGNYDHSKALVIDPIIFSTYIGGSGSVAADRCNAIALDAQDNVYIGGSTGSVNFPVTTGGYQNAYGGMYGTAFVDALSSDGATLLFGTFLGGGGESEAGDSCNALALDSSGDVFIAGSTGSQIFPTTLGAFQSINHNNNFGNRSTGFISKLNADGSSLVFGTYLGGSGGFGSDICNGIAITGGGDVVVVGSTGSTDFPKTANTFGQSNSDGQGITGFVSVLSPTGTTLLVGSYLGGNGTHGEDNCLAVAYSPSDGIVVAGYTGSTNLPVSGGAVQSTIPNSQGSGFVVELEAGLEFVLTGTYLGGNGNFGPDQINALALDSSGNVYVAGQTGSSDFPTTTNAFEPTDNSAGMTGFVSELSSNLTGLTSSTYFGGGGTHDDCESIALDEANNIVVAGSTNSYNLPFANGFQPSNLTNGGNTTGFVAKVSSDGTTLMYGSYLGGTIQDACHSVALDSEGNGVVAGETQSTNFPVSTFAFDPTDKNDYGTGFVTKFSLPALVTGVTLEPSVVVGGQIAVGTVQISSPAGPSGVIVTLASNNGAASVSANVVIPAGATDASFPIQTSAVSGTHAVASITASYDGSSQTAVLYVSPATVSFFLASPLSVAGGQSSTGLVFLSGPAGPSGDVVSLSSNMSTAVVPATVTVPAGANAVSFPIQTKAVSTVTIVTLTAEYNNTTQYAALTVGLPTLSFFLATPSSVESGQGATGVLLLSGPAGPSGAVVHLATSVVTPPVTASVIVPTTVTVPAGATDVTFPIQTAGVATTQTTTITATYNSASESSPLLVTPATVGSLVVSTSSVIGGQGIGVTVNLTGPAGSDLGDVVSISTSNSGAIPVPTTATVANKATSVEFVAKSNPVSATTVVTLKATFNGTSQTAAVTVNLPGMSSFSVAPTLVVGGAGPMGTVSIRGYAGPSGDTVSLTSSNPAVAAVPSSVSVPSGHSATTFLIETSPVAASTTVTMVATIGSSTKSTTLVVTPPTLSGLSLTASSVVGGIGTSGTVTLNGAAPTGGTVVKLTSSSADVTVPASVTIPASQTSLAFGITTKAVTTSTPVTITATLGSTVLTKTLTLTP